MSSLLLERFNKFWINYPKKRNKGSAKKVWLRIKPSEELLKKMLAKIMEAKRSKDWQQDNGKYIPYPSSWLSAMGWEDEFAKPVPAQNQPPQIPREIPRKETKQERELLNKMKALTKPPYNWRNQVEVKKMTIEMKKLQKQYNDLRNTPQKLGDLL